MSARLDRFAAAYITGAMANHNIVTDRGYGLIRSAFDFAEKVLEIKPGDEAREPRPGEVDKAMLEQHNEALKAENAKLAGQLEHVRRMLEGHEETISNLRAALRSRDGGEVRWIVPNWKDMLSKTKPRGCDTAVRVRIIDYPESKP
jgi:hypothetical protein